MPIDIDNAVSPSLARRLAAIFYDFWLVAGLWLLGATADFFVRQSLGWNTDGASLALQVYLPACPFAFFGWFWTHGGQTLGMRAWRMQLFAADGEAVPWRLALMRVASAYLSAFALGLGYLWQLVDRERRSWHDRLSSTRLVMTAKK